MRCGGHFERAPVGLTRNDISQCALNDRRPQTRRLANEAALFMESLPLLLVTNLFPLSADVRRSGSTRISMSLSLKPGTSARTIS